MKIDVGGTAPTALEGLLVDRIVVCWLQLQQADGLASQIDTLPAKMASLILRRQKHADRQFLTAVHTLAMVRRLQPVLVGQTGLSWSLIGSLSNQVRTQPSCLPIARSWRKIAQTHWPSLNRRYLVGFKAPIDTFHKR